MSGLSLKPNWCMSCLVSVMSGLHILEKGLNFHFFLIVLDRWQRKINFYSDKDYYILAQYQQLTSKSFFLYRIRSMY